jgi:AcrR family transcriptional regulator
LGLSHRDNKKLETRSKIIKKAHELFNKYGVADIGMRKLASESGLGLGTYYNYFRTKDEIVFAISDNIFLDSFEKAAISKDTKIDKRLNKLVVSILENMNSDSEIIFYLVQIISNPDHYVEENSEGRKFTEVHLKNYFNIIEKIVPSKLNNTDVESFSRLCWHQLMIFVYMWFMDKSDGKPNTRRFIETTHSSLCYGIL